MKRTAIPTASRTPLPRIIKRTTKTKKPLSDLFKEENILTTNLNPFPDVPSSHVFAKSSRVQHIPHTQLSAYPLCCGAQIISGYPYVTTYTYDNQRALPTVKSCQELLRKDLAVHVVSASRNNAGMVVTIINHTQRDQYDYGKVLEEFGFRAVAAASNPVHVNQTRIFMYTLDLGAKKVEHKT